MASLVSGGAGRFSTLRSLLWVLALAGIVAYSEKIAIPDGHPGRVKVTYWDKWTGFEADSMRALVSDFNRSQDKIWVEYLSVGAVNTKTLLASSAHCPPDVAGVYDSDVVPFADDNAAMPLDDYCREAGIKAEDYIPAYWNICHYNGHTWALPTTPASTALHYNTDLFRAAGLDPAKPPKTIEELTAMADKLTVFRKGHLVHSGFIPAEPGWWNWGYGYLFGGRLWDGHDKITANSPENVRAMTWVQSFSKKYGPSELHTFRSGFGGFNTPENAFMSGLVAMEIQGVWMGNFISQYGPNLHWAAAPFPYPADRPDLANNTFVGLDVLIIPNGARHPKEAFEFLKYVESQKAMEKLCLLQRKHSPLMKVSENFYKEHPNPFVKLFWELPLGKNALAAPQLGIWPEYTDELNSAFDAVVLMDKTPKQALDDVQARMQPKLDRYLEMLRLRETPK